MIVKKRILILFMSIVPFVIFGQNFPPEETVWFSQPATTWKSQALHIGNGYMGASFYGGIKDESIDIAEKTFWTGKPAILDPSKNNGKENLSAIRKEILGGNIKKADELTSKYLTGNDKDFGYFSSVGKLKFNFPNIGDSVHEYVRGIDLSKSIAFVQFKSNNILYKREMFCSYPNRLMAIKFSADKKACISFQLNHILTFPADSISILSENEYLIQGTIKDNGLKYAIRMKFLVSGGWIKMSKENITVNNADSVAIMYTIATSYKQHYPDYKGENPFILTRKIIDNSSNSNYEKIRSTHINDYQNLYNRTKIHLAVDHTYDKWSTDQRIANLKSGNNDDSGLKALYYNFGRYFIISASRPSTLPSNLQGTWNTFEQAPWSGNYQSNINLEEMYWSCGPTNLPECGESYINWIKDVVPSGKITAKYFYGTDGWVSHSTGNIWGYSSPGSDIMWGMYPSGATWHCRYLWEKYTFTQDKNYLKEIYPILKDAAIFWMQNLVKYNNKWIVAPTVSAEHGIELDSSGKPVKYSTVNGESQHNKIYTEPAFQDIEMVTNLFSDLNKVITVLHIDANFQRQLQSYLKNMYPLQLGKYGQLQEWIIDADNPHDHHRHIAHLYGLYPGDIISKNTTPTIAKGIETSLNMRGFGKYGEQWPHAGGNWSMLWRAALWARLGNGNMSINIFNKMITESGYENLCSNQSGNFQVDATMATAGLFAEMLLQSQDGYVNILPALPTEWPEGSIKGLKARGGYSVDISWKNNKLNSATIFIPKGNSIPQIRINNQLPKSDHLIQIVQL